MFERFKDEDYQIVANEVSNESMESALWAKALVKAHGSRERAIALYIKLRLKQIYAERRAKEADQLALLAKQKLEERKRFEDECAQMRAREEANKRRREEARKHRDDIMRPLQNT
ncbi:MAG: hypothetical protein HC841_02760 [Verrucomicrobiae bacterium]|nr:hypothetical protein [Verrucomicrobiae bacterium]